jgi:hypothetical protein
METSILTSTKKILGISEEYTAFDLDVLMCINSAFTVLNDLGVGPKQGFSIEDSSAVWDDFTDDILQKNAVKTYVYLKVRMLFDPPTTSFLLEALNQQIAEHEWRLNVRRESNVVSLLSSSSYDGASDD